jgi:hypothetical protein
MITARILRKKHPIPTLQLPRKYLLLNPMQNPLRPGRKNQRTSPGRSTPRKSPPNLPRRCRPSDFPSPWEERGCGGLSIGASRHPPLPSSPTPMATADWPSPSRGGENSRHQTFTQLLCFSWYKLRWNTRFSAYFLARTGRKHSK